MTQQKLTYANKSNRIPIVNRPEQVAGEDLNEIKNVVNANADDVTEDKDRESSGSQKGYKVITPNFDFTNIPAGYDNSIWEIRYEHDLLTNTVILPPSVELYFKGGFFKNGTIQGDNTKIKAELIHIFNSDLVLTGSWGVGALVPEWFGAIGYDKKIITNFTFNYIPIGLTNSTIAIQKTIDNAFTSGITTVHFNKLYHTTDEITIPVYTGNSNTNAIGFKIDGIGDNSGLIHQNNDANKYVIAINADTVNLTQFVNLANFAIYVSKIESVTTELKGGIYMNEVIRTSYRDLLISGGFCNVTNGLITLHSELNNNIFLNTFDRCRLFNTGAGNGIHYKHETFQPTLQSITNCMIHQLGGCAIVADVLTAASGGFGGLILGNELEGNEKGAIALSSIGNLIVAQNYFEQASFDSLTNFYTGLPASPWTFGVTSISGSDYTCNITGLTFMNNQTGAGASGTPLDYSMIFCGTLAGSASDNINIVNNKLSAPENFKYIAYLNRSSAVTIENNAFSVATGATPTIEGLPFIIASQQTKSINFSDDDIKAEFSVWYSKINDKIINTTYSSGLLLSVANYPYPTPAGTGRNHTFKKDEIILASDIGGFFKCISEGGYLHYNTTAAYVSGSADVVVGGSSWDWQIGDVVNSPYITNGTATIINIVGTTFTLSETANKTIDDWLLGVILVPLDDPTQTSGTFAAKPTVKKNNIAVGFTYFCTDRQTTEGATNGIPIYHKGDDVWVDALGRTVV